MKRILTTLACLAGLAATPTKAALLFSDILTNYPLGGLSTNSGGLWFPKLPGSLTVHDVLISSNNFGSAPAVSGRRLDINNLGSEYLAAWIDQTNGISKGQTNLFSSGQLYMSFILEGKFLPASGGTYFATFSDAGVPIDVQNQGFEFRGRVFQVANPNVYPFTTTVGNTFRLGVANAAGDTAQGGGPSATIPVDLVRSNDYQVVLKYDMDAFGGAQSTLWINPASESDTANMAGPTFDFAPMTNGLSVVVFRQRSTGGEVLLRNLMIGTSFADVVTNAPSVPKIGLQPVNLTNYTGNPALMEVAASSIGGGQLLYQWYQIVGGVANAVPGANGQTYLINQLSTSDAGQYFCAITNGVGTLGALSGTNTLVVLPDTAPSFKTEPVSGSGTLGGKLTLSCSVIGSGPLTYQWYWNGAPLNDGFPVSSDPSDKSTVAGSMTPTLTVSKISTNDSGAYSVVVMTGAAVSPNSITSSNAVVTINAAKPVNISFLRSLEDSSTWQIIGADLYTVTGIVSTFTNITSGNTSSYYIQDTTAGINLFVTGDNTFRPQMGDVVTATGTLSSFNNSLELSVDAGQTPPNGYQSYAIVGHTNLLPTPVVFGPLSLTNNPSLMETNLEGRLLMLTNVWFNNATATTIGSGNTTLTVTNSANQSFTIYVPAAFDLDLRGHTVPAKQFAWSITGASTQSKSGAYGAAGYELQLTRWGDLVTDAPTPVTCVITRSGGNATISWTAVPYTAASLGAYSYSVLAASSVNGPYSSIASGLTFNTTAGSFTDTTGGPAKFYKVSTP